LPIEDGDYQVINAGHRYYVEYRSGNWYSFDMRENYIAEMEKLTHVTHWDYFNELPND
jgi:hypothetical protein